MKKNKMMRIASVLLVAVLLSTCAISGTFAKYTSTYTGTATATVATWAFDMNGEAIANSFSFNLGDTVKEIGGTATETEVNTAKKVIAPGTQGAFAINLKNNSDVTATYTITVELDGTENPPIVFDVPNATGTIQYGNTATITANWTWAWSDAVENQYAGQDLTATITITLTQVD